jgi:osmotically-inducible protein OsmY
MNETRPHQRSFLAPFLLAASMACVSACATYAKCGLEGCPTDRKITVAVKNVISKYPSLEAPNSVRVQTSDHVVYLYGEVNTELERLTAQQAALSVNGVDRVVNSISLPNEGR